MYVYIIYHYKSTTLTSGIFINGYKWGLQANLDRRDATMIMPSGGCPVKNQYTKYVDKSPHNIHLIGFWVSTGKKFKYWLIYILILYNEWCSFWYPYIYIINILSKPGTRFITPGTNHQPTCLYCSLCLSDTSDKKKTPCCFCFLSAR